jgi:hypothetical protein
MCRAIPTDAGARPERGQLVAQASLALRPTLAAPGSPFNIRLMVRTHLCHAVPSRGGGTMSGGQCHFGNSLSLM